MPQTKFTGSAISGAPNPATLALDLSDSIWIVGILNGNFMKMVKLRVTGATDYDWIATKFYRIGDGNFTGACEIAFSESCFVGNDGTECLYTVQVSAKVKGIATNITYLLLFESNMVHY